MTDSEELTALKRLLGIRDTGDWQLDLNATVRAARLALELATHMHVRPDDEGFTDEDRRDALSFPARPLLRRMVETYTDRRGTYGASEQKFADFAMALFPDGLTLDTRVNWVRFGLFVQIMSKMSRYSRDWNDPHPDSVHDLGPYAAMLEAEDRRHLGMAPFYSSGGDADR